jgi:hypothetical protein
MAQHDMNIANQGFPAFRSDLNDALAALVSQSSGATAPATTFAHQVWIDTAADPSVLKIRNADNDAWVSVLEINQTTDLLTKVYGLVIGTDVQAYDATIVVDADIGVSVQAYDADTAKTDVAQTFTVSQRGTVTTDNDGSFDLSVTNNFQCTPSGSITLTFTNRTAGQSGFILLINTGANTVSAHADTEVSTTALATISAAGTYLLSYFATSTNVYVVNSGALA